MSIPNLHLVPSKPALAGATVELTRHEDGETYLRRGARRPAPTDYSFVFLDCPPSFGPLTVNALAAADRVLDSGAGRVLRARGALQQLVQSINLVKARLNPRLAVGGVLLTMVDGRTRLVGRRRGGGAQALRRRSCSRRRSRAPCVSRRRRATVSRRSRTTAARAARTPTGRWRWSLSSARETTGPRPRPRGAAGRRLGGAELAELPVDAIHPNPKQPRRRFDSDAGRRACRLGACGRCRPTRARSSAHGRRL